HRDLTTCCRVEVCGLSSNANLELLNTFNRSRHNAVGNCATTSGDRIASEAAQINCVRAVHVARVVAAVEHEHILICIGAGNRTGLSCRSVHRSGGGLQQC